MSEDTTQNLSSARSFEERIFARLDTMEARFDARFEALENRLATLDERVDRRLMETRPIWEGVQARLTEIESTLGEMNYHMKTLVSDSFKLRVRIEKLEDGKFENSSRQS